LVITSLAGLTIFALIQAQLSGLRERVAVARNLILTKPVDALILAIQATHKASTTFPQVLSAAQSNLFATLEASRELNVLRGHEGAVTTLAFSPNSPTIVSGGKDGTVRLWNLKGEFQILGRHESEVTTVAFSPKDNNTFISGGRDGTVRRWNLKGEFQILGRHEGGVTAVAFSPTDSNTFISSGRDSTVRLWNLKGSYKIIGNLRDAAKEDGKSIILSVAFSPDGKTIASGGDGFVLRLWHLDRITMPMELSLKGTSKEEADNAGFGCITSIAFSSDGNEMIAGQAMQSFPYKETLSKLSSLNYNDKPQITEIAAHEFSTYSVAFNPRNNVFVSGGDDGTLQLRNLNGELITQPLIGHVKLGGIQCYQLYENTGNNYSSITAVSFSHNGELIASAGADGTVRIWSTEAFPSVKSIQIRQNGDADAFQVSSPVYEEFESNLKLFRPDGSAIQLVKRNDALEIQEIVASPDAFKPENDRTEVFYSSDGKVMALVEQGNKIQIRDNAGLPIGKSFIVRDKVQHLAFNSDRRRVVVVGDTNMVEVRDFEGDRIGSPFLHQGEVHSIALSLDGQIIVTANSVGYPQGGGDSTLRLWDIEGNFIVSFKQPGALFNSCGQYCSLLAFSSSGKSIISYSYINHPSVRILPGNWQALFSIACERLRNHPILKAPKDDNSRDVKDLCKGY
jgi:WD40 repeat protein